MALSFTNKMDKGMDSFITKASENKVDAALWNDIAKERTKKEKEAAAKKQKLIDYNSSKATALMNKGG